MERNGINKLVKHFLFYGLLILSLTGCKRLDTIEYSPKVTPEDFLNAQHYVKIQLGALEIVLSQPSSSFIVFFVSLFAIFAGYRFLSDNQNQKSRLGWGIGLVLTGIGALFAGTSYQAFGYEIKCSGRDFCTWTSWWEIIYLGLSAPGMNAFLIASAYSNARGNFRKAMISYALVNTVVYSALLLYGALVPIRFLVSFEFLVLTSAPTVFFLIWMHGSAYAKYKDNMNLHLRNTWLIFIPVVVAYTVWLSLGITQPLWQKGIWFTENDVLHVGMICWIYYIMLRLKGEVKDRVI